MTQCLLVCFDVLCSIKKSSSDKEKSMSSMKVGAFFSGVFFGLRCGALEKHEFVSTKRRGEVLDKYRNSRRRRRSGTVVCIETHTTCKKVNNPSLTKFLDIHFSPPPKVIRGAETPKSHI